MRDQKARRNDPCPCGSGLKFKRCHGGPDQLGLRPASDDDLRSRLERVKALAKQRESQQGHGRGIISTEFRGTRIVAVGRKVFHSTKWKTFHDFLDDYLKLTLSPRWGTAELKKPREERHPILNWYHDATVYLNAHLKVPGQVAGAAFTGPVSAYYCLAYDLYCLAHNSQLQTRLIRRLKNRDHFTGAYYEIFVAASLSRAGFNIEFEDENDGSTSHCELVATFRGTGKKFSVEAKSRQPGKDHLDVGKQLRSALEKDAIHPRIVFIEVNVPSAADAQGISDVLGGALNSIRSREEHMTIKGQPAPPAYVIVSNYPFLSNEQSGGERYGLVEGFRIPDFKVGDTYSTIREAIINREKHREIIALADSIANHTFPPATFDGEIPEFAFGSEEVARLLIGNSYKLPGKAGKEIEGELLHATVSEKEKVAHCIFRTRDGDGVFTVPLTDAELAAYRKYPDTFFGVEAPHSRGGINDPLDLYDWLYNSYRKATKERLLELLKDASNIEQLSGLNREELASIYCERTTTSLLQHTSMKNPMQGLIEAIHAKGLGKVMRKSGI
jgi:hypothetical protein